MPTEPGKAALRTLPPRGRPLQPRGRALGTPARRGPPDPLPGGRAPPSPWRCHTPSGLCTRLLPLHFLDSLSTAIQSFNHVVPQDEVEGPCLALRALPGRTSPPTWPWPGFSQRSALICLHRTCTAAAHPACPAQARLSAQKGPLLPAPSQSLLPFPAQGRRHGPGEALPVSRGTSPPPTVITAPGTQLATCRPRHWTGRPSEVETPVSAAPCVAPARPILHKCVLKEQTEKG